MIVILYFLISNIQYLFYRLLPLLDFIITPKNIVVLLFFMMNITHEASFCLPLIDRIAVNYDLLFSPEAKSYLSLPTKDNLADAKKIFEGFYDGASPHQLSRLLNEAPNNVKPFTLQADYRMAIVYNDIVVERAISQNIDYSLLNEYDSTRRLLKTRVAEQMFVEAFLTYEQHDKRSVLPNPYYSLLYCSGMMDKDCKQVCSNLVSRIQIAPSYELHAGHITDQRGVYGMFVKCLDETQFDITF